MKFKWEKCITYPGEINLLDADKAPGERNNVMGWVYSQHEGPYGEEMLNESPILGWSLRTSSFDSQYEGGDDDPVIFPTVREAMRTLRREVTLFVVSGGKYGIHEDE